MSQDERSGCAWAFLGAFSPKAERSDIKLGWGTGRVPFTAIFSRQPQAIEAIKMQVEPMMESECSLSELVPECFETFTLEPVSLPPDAPAVVPPPVIPFHFCLRPAFRVFLWVR
mmetsp:Transcript_13071/g.23152  ORF Transcript_13071/g.23152 Transcript_13071/m.23152 type:complete len:114 (+) Transcript_13071:53-394(+)